MTKKNYTAIYLRLSVEDKMNGNQEESNSITNQRKILLEYIHKDAELAGEEVVEFCDDGVSGKSMDRPGVQELLKQVKQGKVACILVKDMSRFSRDYIELGTYLNQIFPFMGVRFISVNDHYDSRQQNGNAIGIDTAFQTLLYDLYSKDLSVKVKSSHQSKKASGEYITGEIPFGYARSQERKNAVIVNEKEAEVVRYIFSLAAEGFGSAQIARRLVEEQIPAPMRMRHPERADIREHYNWIDKTVRRILSNRFYLGEMIYGKTVRKAVGSKSVRAVPREEWKVISKHHEPLVTEEMFSIVNWVSARNFPKRTQEKYSLTGKVYCGGCGYAMNKGSTKNHKCQYLYCARYAQLRLKECCTYFSACILEEIVLKVLYEELKRRGNQIEQKEKLELFLSKILSSLDNICQVCEAQCRELISQKDVLYVKYAGKQMGADEYRCQADLIDGKIKELTQKKEEAEKRYRQAEEARSKNKDDMKQIIKLSHLEGLTKDVADTFVKRIKLYRDKRVEIEWNFTEGEKCLQ